MAAQTEAEVQATTNSLNSGLMHVLQPSIEALDHKVNTVRWEISISVLYTCTLQIVLNESSHENSWWHERWGNEFI
jgi:hypothetical protein